MGDVIDLASLRGKDTEGRIQSAADAPPEEVFAYWAEYFELVAAGRKRLDVDIAPTLARYFRRLAERE